MTASSAMGGHMEDETSHRTPRSDASTGFLVAVSEVDEIVSDLKDLGIRASGLHGDMHQSGEGLLRDLITSCRAWRSRCDPLPEIERCTQIASRRSRASATATCTSSSARMWPPVASTSAPSRRSSTTTPPGTRTRMCTGAATWKRAAAWSQRPPSKQPSVRGGGCQSRARVLGLPVRRRIGRTGRMGDKEGVAVSLLTEDQPRMASQVMSSMLTAGQQVPEDVRALARRDKGFNRLR